MKTIHKLVLKAYLGPMVLTFFIVMFVLMMNIVWRYIDELVGKGLSAGIIIELMTYFMANMIPMGLLTSIAETRADVPFPILVEILIMEGSFYLINEASTRIPTLIDLMIIVGVGLETVKQIDAQLQQRHYEGLLR